MPENSELLTAITDDVKAASAENTDAVAEEYNHVDKELDNELKSEQIKTWRLYNETLGINSEERKKYAGYIFKLTCIWASLIFVIIFFQGFGCTKLSDKVVITLITSTTINFFGFFLLVTKYLFNSNEHVLDNRNKESSLTKLPKKVAASKKKKQI